MKNHILTIMLLLAMALSGCSAPADKAQQTIGNQADSSKLASNVLNRDGLGSYSSTFTVHFEGPSPWTYQLKTRKSPTVRELTLHIEGINQSENPGDIRLVTDGTTSWMIGPGTDQECIQFPNNAGMDPTLIYPETLIPQQELANLVKYTGEEKVAGAASLHYSGSAPSAGGWQNVRVDTWQEKTAKGLLKFNFEADGNDQIFNAGSGKITAVYEAAGMGPDPIQPVKGCEISVPLPDSVEKFVRFPGLASFDSATGAEEIRNFYQSRLPQENWAENEPPAQAEGAMVLSYRRDTEGVEIHILAVPEGGSNVKILFMPVQ